MTPAPAPGNLQSAFGLLDWLWLTTWQAAVLIALVALVCIAGRRVLAPRWRYALWLLVAVRLVMPALPQSPVSLFNFFSGGAEAEVEQAEVAATSVVVTTGMMDVEPSTLPPLMTAPAEEPAWTWQQWLIAAWLGGAALCAAVMLLANVRLLRALRREATQADEPLRQILDEAKRMAGVKRKVRLLIVPRALGMPALVGWWRPAIVLPPHLREKLDGEQLRFVMLHELAHLKRHDVLVQWLLLPLHALHWFNPLVWWAGACLRNERELACDEQVLRWTQPQRRAEYGRSLLAVMELTRNMRALRGEALSGGAASGAVPMATSNLFRRIDMISRSDRQVSWRRGRGRGLIGLVAVAAVMAVGLTGAAQDGGRLRPRSAPTYLAEPAPATADPYAPRIVYPQPGGRPMIYDPATNETRPYVAPRRGGAEAMRKDGGDAGYGAMMEEMMMDPGDMYEEMSGYGSQTPRPAPPPPAAGPAQRAQHWLATAQRMPAQPESARRLASVRIDVNFQQNALRDVIDFIADSADVNIVVHWQHLERAGFDPQAPVTIQTREPISAATTLQLVLEQLSTPTARLTMEARPEVVVISADGGERPVPDGFMPGMSGTSGMPVAPGMPGMGMDAGMAGMMAPGMEAAPPDAAMIDPTLPQAGQAVPQAGAAPNMAGAVLRPLRRMPGGARIVGDAVLQSVEPEPEPAADATFPVRITERLARDRDPSAAVLDAPVEAQVPAQRQQQVRRLAQADQDQAMQLRHASMSNLKKIGLMLHLYAADHDGRLPEAISEEQIGRYAQDHGGWRAMMTNPRLNKFPGYVYHRPAPRIVDVREGAQNAPVAYEAFDTWTGEIAIAFLDGHVETIADKDRARKLLEQMNAKVRFD